MRRSRSNDLSARTASDITNVPLAVVTTRPEAELIVGMLRSYAVQQDHLVRAT